MCIHIMIMATWRLFPINSINLLCTRRLATQDSNVSKLKRSIEKNILPPRPKKPVGPFLQYFLSVKSKLQKEYPDFKYQDIVKKASEQWTQIEPTTKQNLQKQYTEQLSIYKQKLEDYKNSITDDQKMLIKKELMKKEDALEKNQIKQKLVELGKPKRPVTAFFLYMQSKRITKDPQVSRQDWLNSISNEWKNMTIEAKNKYTTQATQLLEKYRIEVKKWEEDMIRAGYQNLLKSNTKSKRNIDIDFPNIRTQNKENIKTGWGTDTTNCTTETIPNSDQHTSTRSLILYNNRNNLRAIMICPKHAAVDSSIDVKQTHSCEIYTEIHNYFTSVWNRFLIVMKEMSKNWKVVREYVFIGTSAILIAIFCVFNLMYK